MISCRKLSFKEISHKFWALSRDEATNVMKKSTDINSN